MSETATHKISGIAYILPKSEPAPGFVGRVGPFGVGVCVRWTSWGIGFDILRAGFLIAIGPAFFWIAHIEKTLEDDAA